MCVHACMLCVCECVCKTIKERHVMNLKSRGTWEDVERGEREVRKNVNTGSQMKFSK